MRSYALLARLLGRFLGVLVDGLRGALPFDALLGTAVNCASALCGDSLGVRVIRCSAKAPALAPNTIGHSTRPNKPIALMARAVVGTSDVAVTADLKARSAVRKVLLMMA